MKRVTLNFIVDFLAFLDFVCLAVTGFIIKFVLPPGTGGRGQAITGGRGLGAGERIRELWSMGRHDWGDVHFILSVIFVVLVLVHVVLHWTWIKCYIKSLFATPWRPEDS
ncbi:MAG: DUF4405 domain-containing protein [Phycisphaerales bacterium]|jgi:hypothetical protein